MKVRSLHFFVVKKREIAVENRTEGTITSFCFPLLFFYNITRGTAIKSHLK
jgi:hypothetical protein